MSDLAKRLTKSLRSDNVGGVNRRAFGPPFCRPGGHNQ